jgi:hypothetical protein
MTEAVDADQAHFGIVGTAAVAQRREGTGRVFDNDLALAAVAARPAGKRLRHALFPFPGARTSVVGVLRIGETVKRQHGQGTAAAAGGKAQSCHWRDRGEARAQRAAEQRRHAAAA